MGFKLSAKHSESVSGAMTSAGAAFVVSSRPLKLVSFQMVSLVLGSNFEQPVAFMQTNMRPYEYTKVPSPITS